MKKYSQTCLHKLLFLSLVSLTGENGVMAQDEEAIMPPPGVSDSNRDNSSLDLVVHGESRVRYENIDGQFRANGQGGDQGILFRSLVHIRVEDRTWAAGFELQDSRSYLTDAGSPVSNSYVNPIDFLQAYVELPVQGLFDSTYDGHLKLGRQTIGIGSQRQIERVSFANVIRSYTGAYLKLKNTEGDEWHLFAASPVDRLPEKKDEVLDNGIAFDEEEFNRLVWGAHYRKANAFPFILSDVWAEAFAYGLHEWDAFDNDSPNRQYVTPGFRFYRAPRPGDWNFDVEGALRAGTRRASSNPSATRDLDVLAGMLIARVGYTFDVSWKPNLALQYYFASGDDDPTDGQFDQFERLFGGRRTDLNNTSLHGPLTPANLSAPSVRFEMVPTESTSFRLTYSPAFLASDTDTFVIGRQRDPGGQSGSFLGHEIDSRFTWQLTRNLEMELGASLFIHGEFTLSNPRAPDANHTTFTYSQLTYRF